MVDVGFAEKVFSALMSLAFSKENSDQFTLRILQAKAGLHIVTIAFSEQWPVSGSYSDILSFSLHSLVCLRLGL